ncbi:Transmembrane_domain-containing protein [Hexamita inflata]|uniref:Transmembrane domain-containing protein n=1 Tax=Hexamita inflata TaxID=28002 RepID=A0AA86UF21_9EUKA|nr:Transmembrane domain-containing protein [Hexamita inflata]CAI9953319.1 Transmembrane domain-containing protein [Hexamita inflata]
MYSFYYFLSQSWKFWSFWALLSSILSLSVIFCAENAQDSDSTRRVYPLRLSLITYVFILLASIFVPTIYKGDGRFWMFMLSANDIFILFFTTQFNPFYLFSTRFPNPEELNGIKILLFSVFELLCYFVVGGLHLLIGWYQLNSKYNQYYVTGFDNRRKFAEWFADLVVAPCVSYWFLGIIQVITRIIQVARNEGIYEDENDKSLKKEIKKYKKDAKDEKRLQKLIKDKINKRIKGMNNV